jgi:hypothetical protein
MEKRTLTCTLTPKELREKGAELGRAVTDWETTEEEKKRVTKDLGDRIKEQEANMKRLSRIVRTGKEEREVDCNWVAAPSSETMRLIRCDTGEEVTSRPMTKEEKEYHRQQPLPLPQPLGLPPAGPIAPPPMKEPLQLEDHSPIAPPAPPPVLQLEDKNGDAIEGEFEVIE